MNQSESQILPHIIFISFSVQLIRMVPWDDMVQELICQSKAKQVRQFGSYRVEVREEAADIGKQILLTLGNSLGSSFRFQTGLFDVGNGFKAALLSDFLIILFEHQLIDWIPPAIQIQLEAQPAGINHGSRNLFLGCGRQWICLTYGLNIYFQTTHARLQKFDTNLWRHIRMQFAPAVAFGWNGNINSIVKCADNDCYGTNSVKTTSP